MPLAWPMTTARHTFNPASRKGDALPVAPLPLFLDDDDGEEAAVLMARLKLLLLEIVVELLLKLLVDLLNGMPSLPPVVLELSPVLLLLWASSHASKTISRSFFPGLNLT